MQTGEKLSSTPDLFGLPIDEQFIFSDHKNIFKPAIKKRQSKLAAKSKFLKRFLYPHEKIFCITTGCSSMSILEQFLLGTRAVYIKRSLFVFTNFRIFHIPTKTDYSYRNSIAHILYSDCQSIQIKGKALIVKYQNEKKEKFNYIAGKEKNKLKNFLQTLSLQSNFASARQRQHLCPRCTKELVYNQFICPNCKLLFKNKTDARRISILYPGGGYFYTRHPLMGIGDAITESLLTYGLIINLIGAFRAVTECLPSFVFLAVILTLEKIFTVHDSNKFLDEFIPMDKNIETENIVTAKLHTSAPDRLADLRH